MTTTIDWMGRAPLPLRSGAHSDGSACCLREMLHYLAHGTVRDAVPKCASLVLGSLAQPLTDSGKWADDAERERVLLPYAARLVRTGRDPAAEMRRMFAVVDEARLIVADLFDNIHVPHSLRSLAPITDGESAEAAWAADAAAAAAAEIPSLTIAVLSRRLLDRGLAA